MRQSRRLLLAVALVALVLGIHRWVRPPSAVDSTALTVPASVLPESASKGPAAALPRPLFVEAQVAAKRLHVVELARGERPSPGDTNFPWRTRNTSKPLSRLIHDPHALLLRNALIDTASAEPVQVPKGDRKSVV